MHLYFINDEPRLIFDSWKYARVRQNVDTHRSGARDFYIADAFNYREALEHIILKSKNYNGTANFKAALVHGSATFVDVARGDGFLLLMIPFDEWHQHLSLDDIPEEYK